MWFTIIKKALFDYAYIFRHDLHENMFFTYLDNFVNNKIVFLP